MSGRMNIQSIYLNRVFQGLSFDMSHDPKHFFNILGGNPPWRGGPEGPPLKNSLRLWKYRSKPLFMPKISFLSQSYPPTLFWGGSPPPWGVESGPPSKILSDYENIGLTHCSCQKSASYLNPIPQPFFGGSPPPGGVQSGPPIKNSFRLWKYRSKPLFMPKISFLSQSYPQPFFLVGGYPPWGGPEWPPPKNSFIL